MPNGPNCGRVRAWNAPGRGQQRSCPPPWLSLAPPGPRFRRAGGGGSGQVAKDALGNDVKSNSWLATHPKGDHSLVQGLKVRLPGHPLAPRRLGVAERHVTQGSGGARAVQAPGDVRPAPDLGSPPSPPQGDPTYIVVTADGTIENYGINAVCTHLGCVVPWVAVSGSAARRAVRACARPHTPQQAGRQWTALELRPQLGPSWTSVAAASMVAAAAAAAAPAARRVQPRAGAQHGSRRPRMCTRAAQYTAGAANDRGVAA